MPDRVPPEGSRAARIVLIGEAPGRTEMEYGRPFVGPSYTDKLLPWWNACVPKLSREQFYIDNVLDYQPPNMHSVPESELRAAMEALRQRISVLDDPWLIVPTGNWALYAITGEGRVSFHQRDGRHDRPGIMDWRGSVLSFTDNRGRVIKVIPTVHPAAAFPFRTPGLEWVCMKDWQRIAEDSLFREPRLPTHSQIIAPSKGEAIEWIRWTRSEAEKRKNGMRFVGRLACSLDVETPYKTEYATTQGESKSVASTVKCKSCGHTRRWHKISTLPNEVRDEGLDTAAPCVIAGCAGLRGKGDCICLSFSAPLTKPKRVKINEESYLGCIGYAWKTDLAICIPTTMEFWQVPGEWEEVKREMAAFHADPNMDFGGQNFPFDAWWCAIEAMPLNHMAWDLMKMHRVQRPYSQWHDLAFQASLDTRQKFWKHEAKLPGEISRWSHNKEQLWRYNNLDGIAQITMLNERLNALSSLGRLEYYMQLEAPIDDELLPLSLHGIRVDVPGRAVEFDRLQIEAKQTAIDCNVAAAMKVIPNIAVSPAKMKTFLYEKHRLPQQYRKNQKRQKVVSTDIVSIRRLMEKFPGLEELQTVGTLVLKHRRLMKKAADLKVSRISADGRQYACFRQDTLLGRLSSAATPKDEGANLQQVDNELRKFYLADTGEEVPR